MAYLPCRNAKCSLLPFSSSQGWTMIYVQILCHLCAHTLPSSLGWTKKQVERNEHSPLSYASVLPSAIYGIGLISVQYKRVRPIKVW